MYYKYIIIIIIDVYITYFNTFMIYIYFNYFIVLMCIVPKPLNFLFFSKC